RIARLRAPSTRGWRVARAARGCGARESPRTMGTPGSFVSRGCRVRRRHVRADTYRRSRLPAARVRISPREPAGRLVALSQPRLVRGAVVRFPSVAGRSLVARAEVSVSAALTTVGIHTGSGRAAPSAGRHRNAARSYVQAHHYAWRRRTRDRESRRLCANAER